MPPTKRARPSFSPPRPGKSKAKSKSTSNGIAKSTSKAKAKSMPARRKRSPSAHNSSSAGDSEVEARDVTNRRRPRRREIEDDDDDGSNDSANDHQQDNNSSANDDDMDDAEAVEAEEPTHMLVAVTDASTTGPNTNETPAIPLELLHRIMQEHWDIAAATSTTTTEKPKMKLSTDAKVLVGEYIDVFVREAIVRSAFSKEEREGKGSAGGGGGGFLEVEDLERVGAQLVLDF